MLYHQILRDNNLDHLIFGQDCLRHRVHTVGELDRSSRDNSILILPKIQKKIKNQLAEYRFQTLSHHFGRMPVSGFSQVAERKPIHSVVWLHFYWHK